MSPSPKGEFRVFLHEWTLWEQTIDAESAEQAAELAEALFATEGPEAFKLRDSGTDGCTVYDAEGNEAFP